MTTSTEPQAPTAAEAQSEPLTIEDLLKLKSSDLPDVFGKLDWGRFQELLALGKTHKVEVIKAVRALTGLGLREAKDLVETYNGASIAVNEGNYREYNELLHDFGSSSYIRNLLKEAQTTGTKLWDAQTACSRLEDDLHDARQELFEMKELLKTYAQLNLDLVQRLIQDR